MNLNPGDVGDSFLGYNISLLQLFSIKSDARNICMDTIVDVGHTIILQFLGLLSHNFIIIIFSKFIKHSLKQDCGSALCIYMVPDPTFRYDGSALCIYMVPDPTFRFDGSGPLKKIFF